MELDSPRLLALTFALAASAAALPWQPHASLARGASPVERSLSEPEAPAPRSPSKQRSSERTLAWDCVPTYWWGYWTWAWQPCAWIDRSYVQGTIGAVAGAGDLDTQVGP
jgi:hypothetical protein